MRGPPDPAPWGRGWQRYALALGITVAAILSQYYVPYLDPAAAGIFAITAFGLAIVYGLPILAFALLVGVDPLRHWARHLPAATWQGLRWYGAMATLGLVATFVLVVIYSALDPSALQQLGQPNPVLTEAASDPWFYVGLSFAIGALEETIFRGWIFGFWVGRVRSWVPAAILSSALFAGMHLYYGFTYGSASPIVFVQLFLTGFAFAATYQASRGNLVIVALLHGATDATAFFTLLNNGAALGMHYGLIVAGLAVAIADLALRSARGGTRWTSGGINAPALPWRGAPTDPIP